ncbi:cache domain-containing sensor histidine kinase [Cohnella zeiphila]|uniref:histidine kinase n=1 Tax=Cohnella zeiphila TaxID=2761120 RepID=A0A7X0SNK6_9BACL|nr:sensor histidine kinase [Cohnella zeiphila]MBB6733307.1 sensor histidine kinase [Cohnella zeiphila]
MLRALIRSFFQAQIRILRRFTVKRRLFLTFLIISVAPLAIVATVSFYYSYRDATQKIETFSMQIIHQVEINADAVVSDYETLLQTVVNEDVVQTDLKGAAELDKLGQYRLDDELKRMLNVKMMNNLAVTGISVALLDNQYSMFVGNRMVPPAYAGTRLYRETLNRADGGFTWLPPHLNEVAGFFQTGEKVLTLSVPIKDRWRGTNFGIAALAVKPAAFHPILSTLGASEQGKVFILDENGVVIYSEEEGQWGEPLPDPKLTVALSKQSADNAHFDYRSDDGRKYLMSFTRMKSTGWTVVNQVPYPYLMHSTWRILTFTIVTAAFFLLLSAYIAALVFNSIFSGIYRLMRSMRSLEKGDFQLTNLEPTGKDEIQRLTSSYDRMVDRLNDVINELYREKVVQQEMQIKALKAQINPHFLYNTLETISSLAKIHGVRDISRMTASLSHIFRYSITGEEDIVPLRYEIRSVEHYLRIIQVRYGDRMTFRIDVPEPLLERKVLKLILQPLVENAVQHGIEPKTEPGQVSVTASLEDGKLRLTVADDGVGIPTDRLMELQWQLESSGEAPRSSSAGSGGIGLLNVKERLWLAYREEASFRLESAEGKGTAIELTLPVENRNETFSEGG